MKKNNKRKRYSKKARMMRRRRITTISTLFVIAITTIVIYFLTSNTTLRAGDTGRKSIEGVSARTFDIDTVVKFDGKFQLAFNDIQEVQIEAAQLNGIVPLSSPDSISQYVDDGTLVQIIETPHYEIEEVSHPYLTPDAKALLDTIALRYHQRDKIGQQLRVTSCLRTDATISKLMRRNTNSVKNSCHLYGTTFDISYSKLTYPEKKVLAQVLFELQQAGHCYVKYERKQPCFHITIR